MILTNGQEVDLGEVSIGAPVTKQITIRNLGDQRMTLAAEIVSGEGSIVTQPDAEVLPGGSTLLEISLNPSVAGAKTTQVVLTNNSTNEPEFAFTFTWTAEVADSFIELPFWHIYFRYNGGATVGGAYALQFRGRVRLYNTGTVRLIGVLLCDDPVSRDYRVWVGPDENSGAYETVGTCGPVATPAAIDWSYRPADGNFVHFLFGDDSETYHRQKTILFSYPTGWNFDVFSLLSGQPITLFPGHQTSIGRTGNDLTVYGDYAANSSAAALFTWLTTVDTWDFTSTTVHFNQVGSNMGYSYTRTIPDSATQGVMVQPYLAQGGTNYLIGTGYVGPFFRSAYDPAVQPGEDPVP